MLPRTRKLVLERSLRIWNDAASSGYVGSNEGLIRPAGADCQVALDSH
jgi:hypothetical protein